MIRITTLLWVVLLVIAGGTVMHVSYQVRHVEKHLSELNRDTRSEQDKLRILSAEWDTLNDPQRIDTLSKRYLTLEATPIARVIALDAIPLKPSDDQLAKLAAATPSKGGKTLASQSASKKPEVLAKAPATQAVTRPAQAAVSVVASSNAPSRNAHVSQPQALDGVGLILARMEKHE
jgi:hypothetical protein